MTSSLKLNMIKTAGLYYEHCPGPIMNYYNVGMVQAEKIIVLPFFLTIYGHYGMKIILIIIIQSSWFEELTVCMLYIIIGDKYMVLWCVLRNINFMHWAIVLKNNQCSVAWLLFVSLSLPPSSGLASIPFQSSSCWMCSNCSRGMTCRMGLHS